MHFPPIVGTERKTLDWQVEKLQGEIQEFQSARSSEPLLNQALEVLDVLHCAETLARKFFRENPSIEFEAMKEIVIAKNRKRGYYG